MIIPIRAKNPPERFPYITLALIALNTLIYAFTSKHFLVVRSSAVATLAVSHATLSPGRLLTSMFLHGSWDHILGNMLFLCAICSCI
jgi:membrane associated rhomboid family serine protease